jgi:hypothetical protein
MQPNLEQERVKKINKEKLKPYLQPTTGIQLISPCPNKASANL